MYAHLVLRVRVDVRVRVCTPVAPSTTVQALTDGAVVQCEWVACQDVIVSVLQGGTLGGPVTGLYGGSSRHVVIKPALAPNGTTLLVFQAANVSHLRVDHGTPSDTHVELALMSGKCNTPRARCRWQIACGGGQGRGNGGAGADHGFVLLWSTT